MGRRWVVKVSGRGRTGHSLYLGTEPPRPGAGGEDLPVRVSYAAKFKTKRDALAEAERRGYPPELVRAVRTWW